MIGFLEEVIHDPELLTQERKAAANIIRCGAAGGRLLSLHPGPGSRRCFPLPCGMDAVQGVQQGLCPPAGPGAHRDLVGGHGQGATPTLVPTCGASCGLG